MALAADYQCRRLPEIVGLNNCINNPRVRITKDVDNYKLALCANSTCIPTGYEDWIKCKNVCPVCRSLPGPHGKYDGNYINTIYKLLIRSIHMSACMCTILVFKNAVMLTGYSVKQCWMNSWIIIVPVPYTQAPLPLQLQLHIQLQSGTQLLSGELLLSQQQYFPQSLSPVPVSVVLLVMSQ